MIGCRPLAEDEWRGLCNAASNPRDKLIFLTGLSFGLRVSEALALRFCDFNINPKRSYVSITNSSKGSNNATFPVPAHYIAAMDDMKDWYRSCGIELSPGDFLFMNLKTKKALTRQWVDLILRDLRKELGLSGKVNTHSFRKTFVTNIYGMTKDIIQTREYSRHKNLNNLVYYVQTSQELDLVEKVNIL